MEQLRHKRRAIAGWYNVYVYQFLSGILVSFAQSVPAIGTSPAIHLTQWLNLSQPWVRAVTILVRAPVFPSSQTASARGLHQL